MIWLWTALTVIYAVMVLSTIVTIVRERRDPVKSLAWIAAIALVPLLGMAVYALFGRNWRKRKMFSRKGILDEEWIEAVYEQQFSRLSDPALTATPEETAPFICKHPV